MDLLATQRFYDYDDVPTQEIEADTEEQRNIQIGELIVNSNSYPIYKGINNIGRSSNCQIKFEESSISKNHAEIEGHINPMTSWICDLNSSNKTILNNIFLHPMRYYELNDNSTIQFGRIKAIYKSCNSKKELVIPETPKSINQSNVIVSIPETLSTTSSPSINQSAREILKNKSKNNVSTEINDSTCEQSKHSTSTESEDIFDAATQCVIIDSYLRNIKDSSLSTEKDNDTNINVDKSMVMEKTQNVIGSTSTPIKKVEVLIKKLNNVEKDIAVKLNQSKNKSSCSAKENSKLKENSINDFDKSASQLESSLNHNPNAQKKQTKKEKNNIDIMETINTEVVDISKIDNSVDKSNTTKSNSNVERIDYESASTQIIGEIETTNDKRFKLAESNFQTDLENEDDDILSRLPEVTISGTLSNSSKSSPLAKRTVRQSTRLSYVNKKSSSSKICKSKSTTAKDLTDTNLNENNTSLKKPVESLNSKKDNNNRSSRSMTRRSNIKESIVSSVTNKKPRHNTRSVTNKEQETKGDNNKTKNDESNIEIGLESQEVAMIMSNPLSNKSSSRNIQRKRKLEPIKSDKDLLTDKAKSKSTQSKKKSSITESKDIEKETNKNNIIVSNKRRKKDVSMNKEDNNISESNKNTSNLNSTFSTKEQILFTGIPDDEFVKIIKLLGGVKVNDPSKCTVLVTDKIRRTTKFLCTLARAIPIVSINWLYESEQAGHLLDWKNYILKDPAMEAKYGFRLKKSLEKAKKQQLLDGYTVLLTPNIISPPISELKAMIASCGGKAFIRAPVNLPKKTIIISHENDLYSAQKWLAKTSDDISVQSTEFLLTGILKQELDFVRHKLI
ncbi:hypothetical protein M0802_007239 [Mischocyttarus mexicanus]|nr:hypothetical protein M0802_007239 [Mischocyttarus mexicanus]